MEYSLGSLGRCIWKRLLQLWCPQTIPAINVLFHAMKQRSQRPKRLAQSQLLKDAGLVVVVVDVDAVMVVVAVGVTVQILGESGVPIRVILLLPVQIHLQVMESKSKMESGWWIASCADGMRLIHLGSMASGICNQSTFCIPATHFLWGKLGTTLPRRRARPLQQVQVQPLLVFPGGNWVDWLISTRLRLMMEHLHPSWVNSKDC